MHVKTLDKKMTAGPTTRKKDTFVTNCLHHPYCRPEEVSNCGKIEVSWWWPACFCASVFFFGMFMLDDVHFHDEKTYSTAQKTLESRRMSALENHVYLTGTYEDVTDTFALGHLALAPAKQMQESTASPSAAVQSTDNDCIASQPNPIKQTTAQTHTLICGRAGRPVVFVYEVGTDWLTVSCLTNDHSSVYKGGFYGLREKGRIKELENDEYTEDEKRLVLSVESRTDVRQLLPHLHLMRAGEESDEDEYEGEYEVMGFSSNIGCATLPRLLGKGGKVTGVPLRHYKGIRGHLKYYGVFRDLRDMITRQTNRHGRLRSFVLALCPIKFKLKHRHWLSQTRKEPAHDVQLGSSSGRRLGGRTSFKICSHCDNSADGSSKLQDLVLAVAKSALEQVHLFLPVYPLTMAYLAYVPPTSYHQLQLYSWPQRGVLRMT
ncbi:hypothetical protein EV424DRAFT_1350373 [Suillus variegatus]|nr:hypothetical protein EV424DRAFT_1350373 [Suillus variegatus]